MPTLLVIVIALVAFNLGAIICSFIWRKAVKNLTAKIIQPAGNIASLEADIEKFGLMYSQLQQLNNTLQERISQLVKENYSLSQKLNH